MRGSIVMRSRIATLLALTALALSACERPPVDAVQQGFRGTGMDVDINPRSDAALAKDNELPVALPAAPTEGPPATAVYQNIQVLKDLNVAQFTRVMLAMTQWVAPPEQSCNYCHVANMASDDRYTKRVARRMLQMTRYINTNWKNHVANTGVTCYTCHRAHVVPQNVWFEQPAKSSGLTAENSGEGHPTKAINLASLPDDPFTQYLLKSNEIRVISETALPSGDRASTLSAESTYALMITISQGLGVNCTYCHNTRSLGAWSSSTPQRTTAYYGIRMVRAINNDYLVPLTSTFPAHRLGVLGDVAKVNCATCHQGLFKPLYGASMAKDYPELTGVMSSAPAGSPTEGTPPPTASLVAAH